MRAYAVEGLDCSGKKTITRHVQQWLRWQGINADVVIGPLVGGRLAQVDARLANMIVPVPRGSATDILRRILYVAEPVLDRFGIRSRSQPVLKVSTHFRAWARAELEHDLWMARAYSVTTAAQVRFAGATLLSTDFAVRLRRHDGDAASGRTSKVASHRFFGPDPAVFASWHQILDRLMTEHVSHLLRLDSSSDDPERLAEQIAHHAIACWRKGR